MSGYAARACALTIFLAASGCGGGTDAVKLSITLDSDPPRRLVDVSAIVGGDKFFWHELRARETEDVTLTPGPRDDKRLVLLYKLDGQARSWQGPHFAAGSAGYRIHVRIDSSGAAAERHCMLPCKLD